MIMRWMHDKFGVGPATEFVIGGVSVARDAPCRHHARKEKRRTLADAAFSKGWVWRVLLGLLLLDILHDIAHLLELLGILVGDFHAELFLEGHD